MRCCGSSPAICLFGMVHKSFSISLKEWPWGELSLLQMVSGGIEVIGGILILIGLFTRFAAFICSGQMAVAYWLAHAPQGNPAFPITNGGDLAVMFTFVFLYIACRGSGIWSIGSARSWR